MSVAYYSEVPKLTAEQIKQVSDYLNGRLGPNTPPAGELFHADGPTSDGGYWEFDLWESEEYATRYHDAILVPAYAHAGLEPPTFRRLEVAWDSTQAPQAETS